MTKLVLHLGHSVQAAHVIGEMADVEEKKDITASMTELPTSVVRLFEVAGWYPGREVKVCPKVPASHPAAAILREFGGLRVGEAASGEECARDDVEFWENWADLDPDFIWSELLGTQLIDVAEVHNGHAQLYMDSLGRCFCLSMVHDAFWFEGETFGEAIERMLLGRRGRPMLRPDQQSVKLYGDVFTIENEAVYKY